METEIIFFLNFEFLHFKNKREIKNVMYTYAV